MWKSQWASNPQNLRPQDGWWESIYNGTQDSRQSSSSKDGHFCSKNLRNLLAASREHASGPIDSKRMLHTCCFQTCSRNLQPCPGATCSKFKFHKLPAGTDVESSVSTHFVGCVPWVWSHVPSPDLLQHSLRQVSAPLNIAMPRNHRSFPLQNLLQLPSGKVWWWIGSNHHPNTFLSKGCFNLKVGSTLQSPSLQFFS